VNAGEARAAAVALAKEIARFPQACMRADRASADWGWSRDLDEALKQEARRGAPVVALEGRAGAARFASGKGRGGDFSSI
jgi:enoyl-CoA hydratase